MTKVLKSLAEHPFLASVARGLDLLGAYNQPSPYSGADPARADAEAFADDWRAIGLDLREAVAEFANESDRNLAA